MRLLKRLWVDLLWEPLFVPFLLRLLPLLEWTLWKPFLLPLLVHFVPYTPPPIIDKSKYIAWANINQTLLEIRFGHISETDTNLSVVPHIAFSRRGEFDAIPAAVPDPITGAIKVGYIDGIALISPYYPKSQKLAQLAYMYRLSLHLAQEADAHSIGYGSLHYGMPYSYTFDEVAETSLRTVIQWIKADEHFEHVVFIVSNPQMFNAFETVPRWHRSILR